MLSFFGKVILPKSRNGKDMIPYDGAMSCFKAVTKSIAATIWLFSTAKIWFPGQRKRFFIDFYPPLNRLDCSIFAPTRAMEDVKWHQFVSEEAFRKRA